MPAAQFASLWASSQVNSPGNTCCGASPAGLTPAPMAPPPKVSVPQLFQLTRLPVKPSKLRSTAAVPDATPLQFQSTGPLAVQGLMAPAPLGQNQRVRYVAADALFSPTASFSAASFRLGRTAEE